MSEGMEVNLTGGQKKRPGFEIKYPSLKGVMSRGFCYFRSILCQNHNLVPLLIHKMLL